MSYARKGLDGSHVYVFPTMIAADDEPHVVFYGPGQPPPESEPLPDAWVCHACSLLPGIDPLSGQEQHFQCRSPAAMIDHLRDHQAIGETVPESAFERMRAEADALAFPLGEVRMTPGVALSHDVITGFIVRHSRGDFGEVDQHDWRANRRAISGRQRVLSAYSHGDVKLFVITEADRSRTTVLLRSEY